MFIIKDKKNKTITYDGGEADAYKKVVYGCYSSEADATFIKYQNTRKAEF